MSLFARSRRDALRGSETRSVSFQDLWGSDTEYRRDGAVEPARRAIRLDAVFACVRLIGTSFAQIPWDVYRDGSKEPVRPTPPLVSSPSPLVLPSAWRFQLATSLALWGNAYGIVGGRDRLGYPAQVEWLLPDRVQVQRTGASVEYRIDGVAAENVFHVQFQPLPGEVVGMAPLEYAGLVELGREAQAFGRKWFTEGATPSAILYSEAELSPEDARRISGSFVSAIRRRRRPAVLGAGLRYEQVSVGASESQFLDTIRENRAQVATVFGIPPEMVGASVGGGGSITYANREQRSLDFLTFCLGGYLQAAQDALTAALPRGQVARPTTAALLRSDLLTRYQAHEIGIRARILTPNEARDIEDRTPLPGGDTFPLLPGQAPTAVDGAVDGPDDGPDHVDETRSASPREIAELIQKVYLGVGVVITAEEARALANRAGADLGVAPEGLGVRSIDTDRTATVEHRATYSPPDPVRVAARRALDWIAEGLAGSGFTDTGRRRASQLANGEPVSLDTIRRMVSYFARHAPDRDAEGFDEGEDGYPSPGRVAWDAWGGDPGRDWAAQVLDDATGDAGRSAHDLPARPDHDL